ncbi:MAG TPA: hypothetical protein VFY81_00030, partial [Gammaproteobacteria bacterium]|nr:hypothetical protein [Gammaproteobacteria bacterium]
VNKDARSTSATTDDAEGNALFIVDATDGSLVWKAVHGDSTTTLPNTGSPTRFSHSGLTDSIPSRVAAIDMDSDNRIDRLYVGDTGGNVWRADIVGIAGTDNRQNWSLTKLASLGRHANTGKANDRRFFHAVDVVKSTDAAGAFDAVIIGSGDRANPLDYDPNYKVSEIKPENWLYMIKDRAVHSSATGKPAITTLQQNDLADLSDNCFQEDDGNCSSEQNAALANGWRVKLEDSGEKSLARPVTFANIIYYTSYVPPVPSSCAPSEGTGYVYSLNLHNASAALNYHGGNGEKLEKVDRRIESGPGIPPEVVVIGTDSQGNLLIKTPTGLQALGIASRYRTHWYKSETE